MEFFFKHAVSLVRKAPIPGTLRGEHTPNDKPDENERIRFSGGQLFFEYLIVVSLKKKKKDSEEYEPQITYQFPKREQLIRSQKEEEETLLKAIPLFCFPDGNNWAPLTEYNSETFSFVLTNIDGSRRFGYCRRLLPHGSGARLPEVYCIISCLGCFAMFEKILDEVEKRRQKSTALIYPFMQGLREAQFPAPGKSVQVKSFIPEHGTEIIELTRPLDSRLEHVDFRPLLKHLSEEKIIKVFASALLERRIIFLAEELSILSQCIHAVAALLYPFTWQHTYIPVLPEVMIETVCSPTPFMVGVQKIFEERFQDLPMEEVLIIDLCKGKFTADMSDEGSIIPPKLQDEMLEMLKNWNKKSESLEEVNNIVTEAFICFFVRTVGHYTQYLKRNGAQMAQFQEKPFRKSLSSRSIRRCLKKFMTTQMFSVFVEEAEKRPVAQKGYFEQKVIEYREMKKKDKDKS
ncbi:DENN domain-containing protein 2D isoform X2 [Protopterus annectens]|uniref:DENN domain-containing protein 2D isoform X2 n=1 Tax=Protopterus annectens TaxID=7888 RepID=UPI001CF998EF|nr:DENN domain-containing protein 2D isoform X2 [Protopterus annectens]